MYEKQVSKVLAYKNRMNQNQSSVFANESTKLSSPDTKNLVNEIKQIQTHLSDQDIQDIVTQYLNGININGLAKIYKCHRTTISQHLKLQGVVIRDLSIPEQSINKAADLYESGLSFSRIGAQLGFDGETIRKRLKKRGMKIRNAHER